MYRHSHNLTAVQMKNPMELTSSNSSAKRRLIAADVDASEPEKKLLTTDSSHTMVGTPNAAVAQPSLVLNDIIATQGTCPSRN